MAGENTRQMGEYGTGFRGENFKRWGGHNGMAEIGLTPGTSGGNRWATQTKGGISITSGEVQRIFEIVCHHKPEQRKLIKRADETFLDIWGVCGSNHRLRKWKARLWKTLGIIA